MPAGLILAAGAGRRFTDAGGGIKQLAAFRGKPLLQWAIDAHCAVDELERVVVVLGAHAEEIVAGVSLGRAEAVLCPNWDVGQSASLQAGMAALEGAGRVIVTLGDQPLIAAELICRFVTASAGTRAGYDSRPGHPVVLGDEHRSGIAALTGDRGAGPLLTGAGLIECRGVGDLVDADADADLPRELDRLADLAGRGPSAPYAPG